jgi:hypothetical protein
MVCSYYGCVGSVNSSMQKLKSTPLINEVSVFLMEKDQSTPFLCPLSDNDNIYVIRILVLHKSTGKYYTVYKKNTFLITAAGKRKMYMT